MTERGEASLRAAARTQFMMLVETKDPDPTDSAAAPPGATFAQDAPSLTAHIRALYEAGVIPVRQIARIAGVSERTLYKYVQKGNWQRRNVRHNPRGAGGRFIPVEEAGRPHATGLKALDPEGAREALARCADAARLSQAAVSAARARADERKRRREVQAYVRRHTLLMTSFVELMKMLYDDRIEANPRAVRVCASLGQALINALAQR